MENLYGRKTLLSDGSTITANAAYIAKSIKKPKAMIVKGYPAVMPQFNYLKKDQIQSIIAYIKSISNGNPAGQAVKKTAMNAKKMKNITAARGHEIANANGCFYCHTTNGNRNEGPTWKNLYGSKVQLSNGTSVIANSSYLIASIVAPSSMIVNGFSSLMPRFSYLSMGQIKSIIAYMKSISKKGQAKPTSISQATAKKSKFHKITASRGHEIAQSKGCFTCHSTNGTRKVGPSWKNLYGRKTALSNGKTITADSAYIATSITDPKAMIVKGYPPVMPSFSSLKKAQIESIIAYIKSISK